MTNDKAVGEPKKWSGLFHRHTWSDWIHDFDQGIELVRMNGQVDRFMQSEYYADCLDDNCPRRKFAIKRKPLKGDS